MPPPARARCCGNTTGSRQYRAPVPATLFSNTTGINNTADGAAALQNNTTGSNNAATGAGALQNNTTGSNNAAVGAGALNSNTTGDDNTADGTGALLNNTTGNANTAVGRGALSLQHDRQLHDCRRPALRSRATPPAAPTPRSARLRC